jgi:hypothetical protein
MTNHMTLGVDFPLVVSCQHLKSLRTYNILNF